MFIRRQKGPVSVQLPDGTILNRSDLPPADTARWVASRKALVVNAVDHGLLDEEEACERYTLSREELASWRAALNNHGAGALRITALQKFRKGAQGRKKPSAASPDPARDD